MRDIRRRIRTVRNIQQITKALKMVAAARLQRAENRAKAARPYAEGMLAVMRHLSGARVSSRAWADGDVGAPGVAHPLLEVREPVNIGVLAISSDRGMAGSYNFNVMRKVAEITRSHERERIKLVTVGRKARAFFAKQQYNIASHFPMPSSEVRFADAREISRTIRELFESREVDVFYIVYTRFYSAIRQRAMEMQLLPIAPPEGEAQGQRTEEYIFEPKPEVLLGRLLPRYVDTEIYGAMLESLASEHGARMTAMTSATDNAAEMIDDLTLDFNRARQASITKELAEIVGGAEALK